MCSKPEHKLRSQSPGKRTKASLILFVIAAALMILGYIVQIEGMRRWGSRRQKAAT